MTVSLPSDAMMDLESLRAWIFDPKNHRHEVVGTTATILVERPPETPHELGRHAISPRPFLATTGGR